MPKLIFASIVFCLTLNGCGHQAANTPSSPPSNPSSSAAVRVPDPATLPTPTFEGTPYDFYLLNLSWSPEFCFSHPDSAECAAHPGFVVHGLWPQRNDGSYPEHCTPRDGPSSDAAWTGLMPTNSLAEHEWMTHGTCTPYDGDGYFSLMRRAVATVKIPKQFTPGTSEAAIQETMEPPSAIVSAFARINPGFPRDSIAVSCGRNHLTAIEVCFDKKLSPIACAGVHTCGATNVKITPPGGE
jgi:ribonuclease T2